MSRNLKIFFGVFLLTLPLWWTLNIFSKDMENFFLFSELARNPQIFTAQAALEVKVQEALPFKKQGSALLELSGVSALTIFVNVKNQDSKVLFKKNADEKLAIASLSKLMGALVVARHYNLDEEITISRAAVLEEESFGQLKMGDRFLIQDLLYPMLMESSNDASAAFALKIGMPDFLNLMNQEAVFLGLENTFFVNHAGLDPDIQGGAINYSTVQDLFVLTRYLKTFHPAIFEILGLTKYPLSTIDGKLHHIMENTNKLLTYDEWPTKVLGGKTGWTPEAQGALILVLQSPKEKGYLVNIILGSNKRFQDMEKLVSWVFNSYSF
ncbi:D-alanyl-D-alanine carboxypeptidase [Patescibacteria group bacterium]|nr:D-alanyl-D-alanine carboxypeptidase [Patescibacteria group bacterium]